MIQLFFISNWTLFLSISIFFVHDQAFSIAFNHWIITTRPLDYSREGTVFRSLILFHLQVFPDGDVKQHVPINITRQRDTWSVWECGCSKVKKPWLLFVKGDFLRILSWESSPFFTTIWENMFAFFQPPKQANLSWPFEQWNKDLFREHLGMRDEYLSVCWKDVSSMMEIVRFSKSIDICTYMYILFTCSNTGMG